MPFEKKRRWEQWHLRSGWEEILGPGAWAQQSLQDPLSASPGAPPAPQGLTCVITLWLAFLGHRGQVYTIKGSERNASHLLAPSPQPQTNSTGLSRVAPGQAPGPKRPGLRSALGGVFTAGLSPLLGAACPVRAPSVPTRPRISFSPAAPSAAPAPLPAGELFSWLPPRTSGD